MYPPICQRRRQTLESIFDTLPFQGTMFGMPHLNRPCGRIDHEIEDGFEIMLGQTHLKFISTPGHKSPQVKGVGMMRTISCVGDTLFAGRHRKNRLSHV